MAIAFDGPNKVITATTETEFEMVDIYSAAKEWDDDNLSYHHPLDATEDLRFTLRYGWVFKPSGYSSGTTITVNGNLVTMGGAGKTIPATSGSQVTWNFDTPATAILIPTGSGLSTEEHDHLMALENGSGTGGGDGMSTGEFIALK